ncbi:MAG: hypothetical protein QOG79_3288, partial [Mycobacterium sp.]|nr:hypothetical protein [Mycobacterium sp.]
TGTDTFTYQLNDGQDLSNIATVTITVGDGVANIPPIANDDALSTDVDTPLTITEDDLVCNDDDPDGDVSQTTGAIIDQPSNGTLDWDNNGNLVYTPNAGYTGTDTFTYQLNDGQDLSNIATVTITVGDVVTNTPPVPGYDSLSTNTDTPLTFGPEDLLANDYDAEGDPLSVDVFDEPINGTLVLNGNGSYTYTPTAGYTGPDQFSYYANDGTDESAYYAVVTINVGLPADTAPIATDDTLTTDADTPLTITYDDLVGNDTDADGDGLDPYIVSDPAHGTLEDNGDGTYTYTPDAGYTGTDTFHYTAYDGYADSTPATVTITVNPVDEAPSLIENVGSNPYELTIVGDRLYVTNGGGTTVTVIDLTTNTEIDTDATAPGTQPITVGQQPFGMAIRGNRLYVVNRGDDTVSVIDLNTNTDIDTDDTTPGVQPINVGDEPSYAVVVGNRLYVSAEFDNAVTVIDLDTNTVIDTDTVTPGTQSIDVGGQPFAMTLVLNRFLLVGNYGGDTVAVFDTDTNTFVDIDPSTPGTQPISGGGLNAPHGLAFAGTNVYIGNDDGTVSVFDASTNAFVDTDPGTPGAQPINAGTGRLTGMVVNGNRLYVANTGANQVVVIDIETNAVVDTIPVGHAPWGLALDGNLLYVANYFDDTVSVIDITPPSVIV